ncbi:MAG: threonine/serine exporter family protein, partial [Prevotella sp.]|nr:threonine/serine exporter family protein [Prevotella sp.]
MRLDLLLRTGCLLMESAADTSRTMRTMKRVAAYLGLPLDRLHIYIVYNMLMVNLSDGQRSFTKFQRVEKHGVNLDTLRQVSHLSCEALRLHYQLDRYRQELDYIARQKRNYSPWQVAVGGGLACGGFCIQFGCDWTAFFYAALAAIMGLRLRMYLNEKGS